MKRTIICITGLPGSGKSAAAEILAAKGFTRFEMSSITIGLMNKEHIHLSKSREFSTALRKQRGNDIVARLALPQIKKLQGNIVVGGIRSNDEFKYLKSRAKHHYVCLVALTLPQKQRFERSKRRKREDSTPTFKAFVERDAKEARWGFATAMAGADFVIANSSTKAELRKNLTKVLRIIAAQH